MTHGWPEKHYQNTTGLEEKSTICSFDPKQSEHGSNVNLQSNLEGMPSSLDLDNDVADEDAQTINYEEIKSISRRLRILSGYPTRKQYKF